MLVQPGVELGVISQLPVGVVQVGLGVGTKTISHVDRGLSAGVEAFRIPADAHGVDDIRGGWVLGDVVEKLTVPFVDPEFGDRACVTETAFSAQADPVVGPHAWGELASCWGSDGGAVQVRHACDVCGDAGDSTAGEARLAPR